MTLHVWTLRYLAYLYLMCTCIYIVSSLDTFLSLQRGYIVLPYPPPPPEGPPVAWERLSVWLSLLCLRTTCRSMLAGWSLSPECSWTGSPVYVSGKGRSVCMCMWWGELGASVHPLPQWCMCGWRDIGKSSPQDPGHRTATVSWLVRYREDTVLKREMWRRPLKRTIVSRCTRKHCNCKLPKARFYAFYSSASDSMGTWRKTFSFSFAII